MKNKVYTLDKIKIEEIINNLNNKYGFKLKMEDFIKYPNIRSFSEFIAKEYPKIFDNLFNENLSKRAFIRNEINEIETVMTVDLRGKAIEYFKKLLSTTLKLPVNQIEADAPLEKYGIDSVMIMELTNKLEGVFGSLSKTLFFEYQDIGSLTDYFLKSYHEKMIEILDGGEKKDKYIESTKNREENGVTIKDSIRNRRRTHFGNIITGQKEIKRGEDIVIIGISGRYPGARNLNEFWENLRNGRDSIKEIPENRWNWKKYFDEDKNKLGKIYTKWGGFIEGVDEFDPLFFNISPREAEIMDPQERLFLECTYQTIEDAGYTRENIVEEKKGLKPGNRIGVYTGVMYDEYQLYGAQEQVKGRMLSVGGNSSSIANRVSYIFNFHGPSIALNTMCSSSLTAIHLACQGIERGECDTAIAGGVNVSIHPNKYLMLSQGKFASSKGRCESFGQGGDGYVPGEGVGAVLLKPLSKAVEDGDHIYGVIRGSMINSGGKTNGYTVPNPIAQGEVIKEAIEKSGVNARSISYIEAHGTGTSLGDPIEIAGLTRAFRQYTDDKQFCAIGSVKSNIGHCESAAGIAAVTKVLLQMKHRELVPSLHSEELNPNIDFGETPFIVQRRLSEWESPEGKPRIAGISAFGAGGANAHIIIEEYIDGRGKGKSVKANSDTPAVIVLSARNEERLKERARDLINWIERESHGDEELVDIAYTLQVGREGMEERLGFTACTKQELKEKLAGYLKGEEGIADIYRGSVKMNKEALSLFTVDEDLQKAVENWIGKGKYIKILDLWVKGMVFNWNRLYGEETPQRISLPTYPFARERYWVEETGNKVVASGTGMKKLHPMVHENTSSLMEQRFSSVFTGEEIFLKDHKVNGRNVLPGVAYLEMAREAMECAAEVEGGGKEGIRLKNVAWARPVVVEDSPVKVNIGLYPNGNGEIEYEVYSESGEGEAVVHSQGTAEVTEVKEESKIDIEGLRGRKWDRELRAEECYKKFSGMGIEYGPGHRGIEMIYCGEGEVLAKLAMPSEVKEEAGEYVLHPSMMDSAFQSVIGLGGSGGGAALPFAIDEVEIRGSCVESMWAVIRNSEGGNDKKFDIDLCDEEGKICVRMKGLSLRSIGGIESSGLMMLEPVWKEETVKTDSMTEEYADRVVFLCEIDGVNEEEIAARMNEVRFVNLKPGKKGKERIDDRYEAYAKRMIEEIRGIIRKKPEGRVLVQAIMSPGEEKSLFGGLMGILKTAEQENPKITGQMIELEGNEITEVVALKLEENAREAAGGRIRYSEGKRWLEEYKEIEQGKDTEEIPWKDGGVYLITGGTGGLGRIFAEEITEKAKETVLILTGRSELSEEKKDWIKELEQKGSQVKYSQTDITVREEVEGLIKLIKEKYGKLDGIIHSAGVTRDNFFLKKSIEEVEEVLRPKVKGVVNLDEASRGLKLDIFILFSSMAGALGNVGQADYAAANGFMDTYSRYRNGLGESGDRYGRMLSINWPLWKEGGMRVDEEKEKMMLRQIGLIAMKTETGIHALYRSMGSRKDQVMVMAGYINRIREKMLSRQIGSGEKREETKVRNEKPVLSGADNVILREKGVNYFRKLISTTLKLPMNQIETDASLDKYGIDSIIGMELTNKLEIVFGSLSKTLFFEYQDIESLTDYFLKSYHRKMIEILGEVEKKRLTIEDTRNWEAGGSDIKTPIKDRRRTRFGNIVRGQKKITKGDDIAIIGISGRYPGARNLNEFWDNLRNGMNSITEIPKDRWDWREYFDEDKSKLGKIYTKWGGFIDDIDKFDPLFFKISPKDAEFMDPQERLFLEEAYASIEDAGYTPDKICNNKKVGVFVGVMNINYPMTTNYWSIANRLSYVFNFKGPSMVVDSACSSSLTALYLAVESLQTGSSECAIAGGVNLIVSPIHFIKLSAMGMLSSSDYCKSFGSRADGFVDSEGVGAMLLKPLSRAIEDGDHIYGVIKGSMLNAGGKTNNYMVPNPVAQGEVIKEAIEKAGINARSISYIEAQGTGTPLGDPIEIVGLTRAFRHFTDDKQYCAIGSVKSNIGHSESAAGMSAITKVLLQMKHRELVPSLHSEEINPNIDFRETPFVLQHQLSEWKVPEGQARIAGISAFGAGGSNAHIIIEEYVDVKEKVNFIKVDSDNPAIIVLSAREEERLKERAKDLISCIERESYGDEMLAEIAYTLQVGREGMEERLGFTAGTVKELKEKLKGYLDGEDGLENVYKGQAKKNKEILSILAIDEDMAKTINAWIEKKKYGKLLDLWVNGLFFDWNCIYKGQKLQRISLPTYPFARESYWLTAGKNGINRDNSVQLEFLKPIAQKNNNDLVNNVQPKEIKTEELKEKGKEYFKKILAEILKIPENKIDTMESINNYGINSIGMIQLTNLLGKVFENISYSIFVNNPNIEALVDYFIKTQRKSLIKLVGTEAELLADKAENEVINAKKDDTDIESLYPWEKDKMMPLGVIRKNDIILYRHEASPKRILLTGVTGTVGAFLCNELLKNTSANLYCLVRAELDLIHLKTRIQNNLKRFKLWNNDYHSRIIPIRGDITKPGLGIENKVYKELSQSIDTIYHCAANVNHVLGYDMLKAPNVDGTLSIIEFAGKDKIKPIQFISSIALCMQAKSFDSIQIHLSETLLENGKYIFGGYGQTKWVSEHHLIQAYELGIPVIIFRLGQVTGSSQNGYGITADLMHNFLNLFSKIGSVPDWEEGTINIVPIDYACQVIFTLSRQTRCFGNIYNLINNRSIPIQNYFNYLQKQNPALSKIAFDVWADSCVKYIGKFPESDEKNILMGYFEKNKTGQRLFQYHFVNFNFSNMKLQNALENTGIKCPIIDDDWWDKSMSQIKTLW